MITLIALTSVALFGVVYALLIMAIVHNVQVKDNRITNFFKKKIDNLKQYFKMKTN